MADSHAGPPEASRGPADGSGLPADESPRGWRVATIAGIPVIVRGGWVLVAIVMIVLFGPQVRWQLPGLGNAAYLVAAAYAALLLVSVLVHEASHAVAARACGHRVRHVVADLMGGHTAYDAAAATPGTSALVAVVGPLSNGVLAAVAWLAMPVVGDGVTGLLVAAAAWTNGVVAVFNLLPGLPLDGGFLLEALVWRLTGSRHTGMIAAGWIGRVLTIAAGLLVVGGPLLAGRTPSLFTVAWAALIGAFVWSGASQAIATGRLRRELAAVPLSACTVPAVAVPTGTPLDRVAGTRGAVVVVLDRGVPAGYVDAEAAGEALAQGRAGAPVDSCLRAMPPAWVVPDPGDGPDGLDTVVAAMARSGVGVAVLVDPAGAPTAVVDAARIDDALRARPRRGWPGRSRP